MGTLDLDAHRAARSEAEMAPHEVTLGGKTYQFRPRMPLEFTEHLNEGRVVEAFKLLLVDPLDWDTLREAVPDDADLLAVTELYAVNLPESPASTPSSGSVGMTSKPTLPATTTPTSLKPAGVRRRSASGSSTT